MTKRSASMLLAASAATAAALLAATPSPAGATPRTAAGATSPTTALAPAAAGSSASAARPHLLNYKIYFGRCKDTCRIKVRITNISRQNLYAVSLNARLKINGKQVGSCYDYVGSMRSKRVRWAGCTVRSSTLARQWNRWLDGEIRWDRRVSTVVHYEYYR
ncbi:hypothetical protein ABZ297_35005 [Nonomuraea sp. NPDC005983]|uniref:hypothetical protein n=1 Tax=Nonomuraea sp. NPDC005983 TaxID=3155595 RepID=UPI0033B1BBBF